jgi:hypothetical protein
MAGSDVSDDGEAFCLLFQDQIQTRLGGACVPAGSGWRKERGLIAPGQTHVLCARKALRSSTSRNCGFEAGRLGKALWEVYWRG